MRMSKSALPELGVGPRTGPPAPTITWITDEANLSIRIEALRVGLERSKLIGAGGVSE